MKPMKLAVACFAVASIINAVTVLSSVAFDMGWRSASPLLATASPPVPGSSSRPTKPTVSAVDANSLLQGEIRALTREGISPTRARQAIGVQGLIAKTRLADRVEAAMGSRFAGVWFDAANALVHIGFTSAASRRTAEAVTRSLGLATHVVETPVQSTWRQLKAAQTRWNRRLGSLLADGDASSALLPQKNAVSITLNALVSGSLRSTFEHLASADTVATIVAVGSRHKPHLGQEIGTSCNAFTTGKAYCDKTITSGVTIILTNGKPQECTAGPLAVSTGSNKADTYLLTAGHCTKSVPSWATFNRSGASSKFGTTSAAVDDETGDYGAILIEPGAWTQPGSDPVLAVSALWSVKPLTSAPVMGANKPVVGTANCHEGATTGESCGKIRRAFVTIGFGTLTTKDLVEDETAVSASGDSGGPWLIITTGKEVYMEGTHVGKNESTNNPVYEPLETSLGSLKLELLTTLNEVRPQLGIFKASGSGKLLGKALATQVITTAAGKVECTALRFTDGTVKAGTFSTAQVTVEYENCKAFGVAAKVSLVQYEINSGGYLSLRNTITVTAPLCTVTIPSAKNQSLKVLGYATTGKELVITPEIKGITSSGTEAVCTYAEESKGEYTGNLLVSLDGGSLQWE